MDKNITFELRRVRVNAKPTRSFPCNEYLDWVIVKRKKKRKKKTARH